jgi:hypothetical protein
MTVHELALFWRDEQARYFTSCHFAVAHEEAAQRAQQFITLLQELSSLQLYGAALNHSPLTVAPGLPAPAQSNPTRLEINLYPAEQLNPRAGVTVIKFSVPSPRPEVAPYQASYWPRLEREVFDYLCLPKGIVAQSGPQRIKRAEIITVPAERQPDPSQPPLTAHINATVRQLTEVRHQIAERRKKNEEPTPQDLERITKYETQLAGLHRLAELEQEFFERVAPASSLIQIVKEQTIMSDLNSQTSTDTPVEYLPSQPADLAVWADVPAADFTTPALWLHRSQLKTAYDIKDERAYFRWLDRLREYGLTRSLPAKSDWKVKLFYQPDIERALAQATAFKPRRGRQAKTSAPVETTVPAPPADQVWTAISQIQAQQQSLLTQQQSLQAQQQTIAATLGRIETALATVPNPQALAEMMTAHLKPFQTQLINLASHQQRQDTQLQALAGQLQASQLETKSMAGALAMFGNFTNLAPFAAAIKELNSRLKRASATTKAKAKPKARSKTAKLPAKQKAAKRKPAKPAIKKATRPARK